MTLHKHHDIIMAWANGARIECSYTGNEWFIATSPTWSEDMRYRVYDEYRHLKEAEAAGKVIELKTSSGRWEALASPCAWFWPAEAYRISPRSDYLRPIIDGFGSGKTVQHRCGQSWVDCCLPRFYADQDYRLKPVWEKELDAYLAGETIQCGTTGMWVDQMRSAALEQELKDGRMGLKFRIKHKHQDCIDAWERGEEVQVCGSAGVWTTMSRDGGSPGWLEPLNYRVKPKEHKHQAVIDAYNAGQTVQCQLGDGTWHDHVLGKGGPPCFSESWEYRIKLPHQEVRDAFAAGKAVQYRTHSACYWSSARNPRWYAGWEYRIKPEPLKSRRYVFNRADKQQVGICTPNSCHQVHAGTFVRWIDDDWVETEV